MFIINTLGTCLTEVIKKSNARSGKAKERDGTTEKRQLQSLQKRSVLGVTHKLTLLNR